MIKGRGQGQADLGRMGRGTEWSRGKWERKKGEKKRIGEERGKCKERKEEGGSPIHPQGKKYLMHSTKLKVKGSVQHGAIPSSRL